MGGHNSTLNCSVSEGFCTIINIFSLMRIKYRTIVDVCFRYFHFKL